jgi:transposase-like protein
MGDQQKYSLKVSDSFERLDEKLNYEIPFRRWLVREIEEGRISTAEAIKRFNFNPSSGGKLIYDWRKKYAASLFLPLPSMTEQEKQELAALQKQLKAMEKQLEEARMRNIALNTLIDVAEEALKVDIRKKPGAKQ